jgi:hypothetical protein
VLFALAFRLIRIGPCVCVFVCLRDCSAVLGFEWSTTNYTIDPVTSFGLQQLRVPATTLLVGVPYTFTVSVRFGTQVVAARTTVTPVASPLTVQLSGGSERTAPVGQPLVLSAANFADPDSSLPVTAGSNDYVYSWSCSLPDRPGCGLAAAGIALDQPTLTIPAFFFDSGSSPVFSLTIRDVTGQRSVSATSTVSTTASTFALSVNVISAYRANGVLRLIGTSSAQLPANSVFAWTITRSDGVTGFERAALTPQGSASFSIAGASLPAGYAYTVRLTETVSRSFALLTVTVPSPPSSGTCSVSPSSGVVLVDTFTLSCRDFVPGIAGSNLYYSFAYSQDNVTVTHASRSLPSSFAVCRGLLTFPLSVCVRVRR